MTNAAEILTVLDTVDLYNNLQIQSFTRLLKPNA